MNVRKTKTRMILVAFCSLLFHQSVFSKFESKGLPNPLLFKDLEIDDLSEWRKKRESILLNAQRFVFGSYPYQYKLVHAHRKQYFEEDFNIEFSSYGLENIKSSYLSSPGLTTIAIFPNKLKGMLVFSNNCGLKTLIPPEISVPTPVYSFGKDKDCDQENSRKGYLFKKWEIRNLLKIGWGILSFDERSLKVDNANLTRLELVHFLKKDRRELKDSGNLIFWSWGYNQVAQSFKKRFQVPMVVFGHSRRGKSSLLAGATETVFDGVISHQSGCLGSTPMRKIVDLIREVPSLMVNGSPIYESQGELTGNLKHFFRGNFKKYVSDLHRIPYDQNELIATIAPRKFLSIQGNWDVWSGNNDAEAAVMSAKKVYDKFFPNSFIAIKRWGQGHEISKKSWSVIRNFLRNQF